MINSRRFRVYPLEKNKECRPLKLNKSSEFLIKVFEKSIKNNKDLIVVYPENTLRPTALLGIIFIDEFQKDALIFTEDNGSETSQFKYHLQRLCLLEEENKQGFLWEFYIPCKVKDDKLEVQIQFRKRIDSKTKADHEKYLNYLLEQTEIAINKIIFSTEILNEEQLNRIKEVFFKGGSFSTQNNIGLFVFENLSKKLSSDESFSSFLKWLEQFNEKKPHFLFHLSNHINLKAIEQIKRSTGALTLYLSPYLLSILCNTNSKDQLDELSQLYNLDENIVTNAQGMRFEVIKINGSGLSVKSAREQLKLVEKTNVLPTKIIKGIKKLLFHLPKLSIHPSLWSGAIRYQFEDGDYRSITPKLFFEELNKEIKKIENIGHKDEVLKLRDLMLDLYYNYDETDSLYINKSQEFHSFSRKTKPYYVLELIHSLLKEEDIKKIYVGVYDASERNLLIKQTSRLGAREKLEIRTLNQLTRDSKKVKNSVLVIPSLLISKYFSEYFRGYKKIYLLLYDFEEEIFKKQKELLKITNSKLISYAADCLYEIYDTLNLERDEFFEEIIKIKTQHEEVTKSQVKEAQDESIDLVDFLKNRILKSKDFEDLNEDEALYEDSRYDDIYEQDFKNSKKDFSLELEDLEDGTIKIVELPKSKTLLKINVDQNVEEVALNKITEGDKIVLIQGDERKSIIDLVAKKMGIEDEVDIYLIKIWKDKLNEFIEKNNLDDKQLFEIFQEKGGNVKTNRFKEWRDSIKNIAPRNKEDLLILGRIINYQYLIDNIDELFSDIQKIRTYHQQIGREINRLIKKKLLGEAISFDEIELSDQIKIFQVNKIKKL